MIVLNSEAGLERFAGGVVVPTMGALHAGHLLLIRAAREAADRRGKPVLVTIFVNPTQFGPREDFSRYPRTLEADLLACEGAGADAVFAPAAEVVYPSDRPARVPALPAVATEPRLEDAIRPGHFAGVCQVVLRLFELTRPDAAVFGEKDWQQLQVVSAIVRQEGLPVEIIPRPTVREPDGLALSSRNQFLSAAERQRGLSLSRALIEARAQPDAPSAERAMRRIVEAAGVEVDYAVVRHATTLMPVGRDRPVGNRRALVAGRVGSVRLLDNAEWMPVG